MVGCCWFRIHVAPCFAGEKVGEWEDTPGRVKVRRGRQRVLERKEASRIDSSRDSDPQGGVLLRATEPVAVPGRDFRETPEFVRGGRR
jgi:hypothetical protein